MKTKVWKKWDRKKFIAWCNRFGVPLQALGVCALYFVIEWMSRHSFRQAWEYMTGSPLIFLYNALLIFMTTSIAFLFRRRTAVRVITFLFWFVLGVINGIILSKRVTPFTGQDMKLLTDAKKIVANYMSVWQLVLIIIGLAAAIIYAIWLFVKGPRYEGKRKISVDISIVAVSVGLFVASTFLALNTRLISSYFRNLANAYKTYGYPYCLSVTIFDTGMDQPEKYSKEMVDYIQEDEEDLPETTDEATKTNVIFLQLESFFDPTTVNFLKFSEDPIPYWHELQKEYSSGMLKVPVVGAGTVNTEFEVITGMSLQYFGAGEYPYKTILKDHTCESIPYDLLSLGYHTHAIHNNEANFYSRRSVYANLGFQTFTSEEYMPDISDVTETGWVKDHILTDEIMKALNSTEGADYVYTVSVQAHGDYPTEPTVENPKITVTGAENREKNNNSWEYYIEQINEMDEFVHELTETLSDYDEPVVLVMFGDHLPTMGLREYDVKGWDLMKTPYIIWDNMGLEKKNETLSACQLGAEVLDRIGIHEGTMMRFHQAERGKRYYQNNLEIMQYDILYGDKFVYGGESPFEPINLQMGVEEIKITGIKKVGATSSSNTGENTGGEEGYTYTIYGENFTASSKVEINGEKVDTIFVSPNALMIQNQNIQGLDKIDIAQQSDSSTARILTRTEPVTALYYLQ